MTPEKTVHRAAQKVGAARGTLERAIVEARAQGMTLRAIAAAAGVSHEEVRRIVARVTA